MAALCIHSSLESIGGDTHFLDTYFVSFLEQRCLQGVHRPLGTLQVLVSRTDQME
ncbi:Hypothetical protein FKW44_011296 [Caligus rogercresseyi]|uniref:Uncharacterized protein n=1 Tax=Caligus rogercresseyi TaxID=217165 RepID=A0A7T8HHT4_CALRO|nr:Hypothetical protein FKW44_011296 [Caligus rogercresseyi]